MHTETRYVALEIRVLERQDAGYPVEFSLDTGQEFPRGFLDPAFLPWQGSDDARRDGTALFRWLTASAPAAAAWAAIRAAHPSCRVRLRIDAEAPELHSLPWELLYDDSAGRAPLAVAATDATPFSRYLAGAWRPGSPILQRPIKVLAAIAAPDDLAALGMAEIDPVAEIDALLAAVQGLDVEVTLFPALPAGRETPAAWQQRVRMASSAAWSLPALEAELRRGAHILHLVAHGAFDERSGHGFLVFADEQNHATTVEDTQVAELAARLLAGGANELDARLRLVFLAACESATRAATDVFRGVAPALVRAGVPAVLAMQTEIEVATSRAFTTAFYRALLEHGTVDLAANQARSLLLAGERPDAAAPVVFMRLNDGRLLGRRGQVLGDQADSFWSTLLGNIAAGECTPFLGPGATAGLLPTPAEQAQNLAAEFNYPFEAAVDLPRVAQFVGTTDNRRLRMAVQRMAVAGFKQRLGLPAAPDDGRQPLERVLAALDWAALRRQVFESDLYSMLAELGLPLYITTNADSFMELALRERAGAEAVRSLAVDWRTPVQPGAARPHFDFDPPISAQQPAVLHLYGTGADPLSVVLTEDDHLDYLARIARDYEYLLPTSVQSALASTTLLFLGYQLEDLDLKVILRGLLTKLDLERWGMLHVAVQLEDTPDDPAKQKELVQYLQRYFSKSKIDVYWGSTQQFVADLYARWQEYRHD